VIHPHCAPINTYIYSVNISVYFIMLMVHNTVFKWYNKNIFQHKFLLIDSSLGNVMQVAIDSRKEEHQTQLWMEMLALRESRLVWAGLTLYMYECHKWESHRLAQDNFA